MLHLDRVVHREVRRISGVSVHLQPLVRGTSSPLRRGTVRPPPIDEGVELAKNDTEVLLPTDSDASEDEDKKSLTPAAPGAVSYSILRLVGS